MAAVKLEALIQEFAHRQRPEPYRYAGGGHQLEQEQLPPHAQPPEVDALDTPPLPTTAKVENMTLVLVLSHSGQTWRSSRLAYPPKTSKGWRALQGGKPETRQAQL